MSKDTFEPVCCPRCSSVALNRDGKARTGKQRFLCLMCGMQFTDSQRSKVSERPLCPECGSPMHLYRREPAGIRFRCSRYPVCKTYRMILHV
ncbi:MAG TPA: IS1 family transposase [Nitrospirota bacterium]|nr:IS1 family transposase [Nitrospirota bacterium]